MRLSFSYNDAIASLYDFLGSKWSFMEWRSRKQQRCKLRECVAARTSAELQSEYTKAGRVASGVEKEANRQWPRWCPRSHENATKTLQHLNRAKSSEIPHVNVLVKLSEVISGNSVSSNSTFIRPVSMGGRTQDPLLSISSHRGSRRSRVDCFKNGIIFTWTWLD